jgi:hypothetical protein
MRYHIIIYRSPVYNLIGLSFSSKEIRLKRNNLVRRLETQNPRKAGLVDIRHKLSWWSCFLILRNTLLISITQARAILAII